MLRGWQRQEDFELSFDRLVRWVGGPEAQHKVWCEARTYLTRYTIKFRIATVKQEEALSRWFKEAPMGKLERFCTAYDRLWRKA